MAIAKAERLMNLALCLLGTRRPLSKRELRGSIEAYLEAGSDDSFNRMFERDKDDLRELGLVIETVENLDAETGYLARRDSNRLPPITLDAEEAAALGLAAKVWQQARLAGAASGALQKLRAAGMPEAEDAYEVHSALEPRIPVHEAAFEPLMLACRDRRPVTFDYRKANSARAEQRQVEPWTLECWRGHWYLAGWDRERGAERVFRLSRITGKVRSRAGAFSAEVPDVVTVRETVESWAGETATRTARIRLRAGAGYPLRSRATAVRDRGDGWDELEIPYGHGLDAWLVEFGPDVVVEEPADLRADVVDRLQAVAKD
ncbi:transcriptional regulator [Streptomyces sp. JS01]|uniref:helix-turn-helix transcriptional regulator n=1 Tax=unclassified Streptomyces TaxID=2593676 RepID=UPI0005001C3F|nr:MULTISPECIES: WYL domain-containing protein [unclassified Streptomyces]KFK86643.1 transcriptional regulator [Streptomyces sp. JS01]MBK3529057.1 WYL domain-containing protein [Streptomyces sp. MBT72]MBK3536600.1 WYL domain-containing protein [Streptomyces sp. MBT67]MBK3550943.1 WYL domain-containing protein [Streptomyces sp. MBT61]MBK6027449.1 WYL domain-containing protein [Streptomyces sp. MBT59]